MVAGSAPRDTLSAAAAIRFGVLVYAVFCAACGSDATGVDACKRIEEARCRRAPGCGIDLQPPHFTSGDAVDACIRFYDTACLHGLEGSDPGPVVVGECVSAIGSGACGVVKAPETDPKCSFLSPAATPAGDASDAVAE